MPRKSQPAPLDGALIVDKPQGRTSHDVVDAARRILGFRQIGHLGTLDPLATGVLVLLLGRATRLAQFYAGRRKRYTSTFRFGFATDTYDADGTPLGLDTAPVLERAGADSNLARYVIPLERLLPELPSATVPPLLEQRVRHGSKFTVQLAQIQPGRVTVAQGATAELNSGEWKPARLRVFSQQEHLIAIAEAVVPRTYQPVVVLEAEA